MENVLAPSEPQLIYFDQQRFDSDLLTISYAVEDLRTAIEKFNAFKFAPVKVTELLTLITDPESLVNSRLEAMITPSDLVLPNGLTMVKDAYLANIQKPFGLASLVEFIGKLNRRIDRRMIGTILPAKNKKEYLNHFSFDQDGQLIATDLVYSSVTKRASVHVYSEQAKQTFEFASQLVDEIKKFNIFSFIVKHENGSYMPQKGWLSSLILIKDGVPVINWEFIKASEKTISRG